MGQILAIDYGKVRTGIAVTDDMQIIASGLTTVETPKLMDFLQGAHPIHNRHFHIHYNYAVHFLLHGIQRQLAVGGRGALVPSAIQAFSQNACHFLFIIDQQDFF